VHRLDRGNRVKLFDLGIVIMIAAVAAAIALIVAGQIGS
jgi:hypothetical protein